MKSTPLAVAQACLKAYAEKDRAAIEGLISPDYRFTSPLDNALDRETYFARCWPNSKSIAEFNLIYGVEEGQRAFITYEARTIDGRRFRNTEIFTVVDGMLRTTEVYFGWNLPHPAPKDGSVESSNGST
jgi:hypothetical protein